MQGGALVRRRIRRANGLGLNAVLGWLWADPLAGIAISGLMLCEAKQVWSGKDRCGP